MGFQELVTRKPGWGNGQTISTLKLRNAEARLEIHHGLFVPEGACRVSSRPGFKP